MTVFWFVARVDWYEFTNVSENCTASVISVHGATTQKTAIFIVTAVRT
jgi:hypothetical protein